LFREAFPNMMIVIEDMVAEGDKVVARCSVRAKHEGEFMGRAATQAPVEFTGIAIVRIDNGKIVEAWNNFDFMTMYKQVGYLS
jgi:predicted ester cyclase